MDPVNTWDDFEKLLNKSTKKIDVMQMWGHGSPGASYIDSIPLTVKALEPNHKLHSVLLALKKRLHSKSVVWFRQCSIFAGPKGKEFAEKLANFLGCTIAAHTYIIGPFQSGLHTIRPNQKAHWSDAEGLKLDGKGKSSGWFEPNTITCLTGTIPKGW